MQPWTRSAAAATRASVPAASGRFLRSDLLRSCVHTAAVSSPCRSSYLCSPCGSACQSCACPLHRGRTRADLCTKADNSHRDCTPVILVAAWSTAPTFANTQLPCIVLLGAWISCSQLTRGNCWAPSMRPLSSRQQAPPLPLLACNGHSTVVISVASAPEAALLCQHADLTTPPERVPRGSGS